MMHLRHHVTTFVLSFLLSNVFTSAARIKRTRSGTNYKTHDPVHVIVNKVGPFNNPMEIYRYYSLPFCRHHASAEEEEKHELAQSRRNEEVIPARDRKGAQRHKQRLGESIVGDRRETSPYEITFEDDVEWRLLCDITYGEKELTQLKDAIHNSWFFEMFVEDLPMWGYIGDTTGEDLILGEMEGSRTYLFPHLVFRIGTNGGKVVSVSLSTDIDKKVDITDVTVPTNVQYTYAVEFFEDELEWKNRMSRYHDSRFLPNSFEVHWLSIINSIVLVLLLTGFLVIIMLRVLKNDFSRYMEVDDQAIDEEESGWKLIHGDVFRFPEFSDVFCAAVGTGMQLIITSLALFAFALTGIVSTTRRGSILAAVIVLYCLSSIIGGYFSSSLYRQMNGKNWVRNVIVTALLFPGPTMFVFAWVNTVAIAHGSSSALPFGTIFTIVCLYTFIAFPMTVLGGILAKNYSNTDFNAPTRTTKVAREIPSEIPWYRGRVFQLAIAGLLPFSAIYIELHYIFATIWGHQIYTMFGIAFLTYALLIIVTSFITVALIYFQLAREDHRWWWVSFMNGGATAFLLYFYSFYFYFHSSEMEGMLQASFYFGYMTILCYAFFLMLGSAASMISLRFVKYIYSRVKCD